MKWLSLPLFPIFLFIRCCTVSHKVPWKTPPTWYAHPTPPGTASRRRWRWERPPPQKYAEPSLVCRAHSLPHSSIFFLTHQCPISPPRHRPHTRQPPKLHQQRVLCHLGALGNDGAAASSPWDQRCRLQVGGGFMWSWQATCIAQRSPVTPSAGKGD